MLSEQKQVKTFNNNVATKKLDNKTEKFIKYLGAD